MDLGLAGKKIIISGGSRGIGRAIAETFAAEGADVAFFSRNPAQVEDTRAALAKFGHKVVGDVLDMQDMDAYKAWLVKAAQAMGGCDIFIHNASASGSQAATDWQKCLDVDILGGVAGCETLEPYLAASGAGAVIILSSTAAVETFFVPQAFNALKAALLTYSKQLSQHWAAKGIRVNAVSPGPVSFPTGNWQALKGVMPEVYEATEKAIPLGRMGKPEDVARAVVFLASPAASYITGTNLIIDGGYTKRVQF
ncbi:SDR family NAD(P)-dependent oxidoreductase [Acidocella sp.]|uniref:SDR family NAD(P)-dependent oxidoreductase n=1 Tax=Acidocella sp. TaxID=50710 RepID=UPI00182F5B55|nr:SDR family oxidoreductase [Acidocella sp.]NNM57373.1 SDR family oxidoreductase [Acidocella sp.]